MGLKSIILLLRFAIHLVKTIVEILTRIWPNGAKPPGELIRSRGPGSLNSKSRKKT